MVLLMMMMRLGWEMGGGRGCVVIRGGLGG